MLSRRQFLKTGVAGAAALIAIRLIYGPFANNAKPIADDYRFTFLNDDQRTLLAAIAPVILAGVLPNVGPAHDKALRDVMRGLDLTISGFLPQVQNEVKQLFDLLTFPPTRRLVAGVSSPWAEAAHEEIEGFLNRWAKSQINLLQTAYQALRQLIIAAWYGNPDSWTHIGYSGPPSLTSQ